MTNSKRNDVLPRRPSTVVHRVALLAMTCTLSLAGAESHLDHFITAKGDQLMQGEEPLRFLSWNVPNLLMIEDNVPFDETNPWRLPNRFELTDALSTVRQLGGNVARTYVITVKRTNDAIDVPRHVLGPGRFNEEAFQALDLALQVANEEGVRLIIPLVDNWSWQGGRAEYAGFRGKSKEEFWTDRQLIEDFKKTVHFILARTNTLTGVPYSEDKAILCWETGNELDSPESWTREISAYIKSLDPNHLVMEGRHTSVLHDDSLEMPDVDIVSTHHYPGGSKSFAELIRENWRKAQGRRPYLIGEFGFVETPELRETIRAIQDTGAVGGLLWSLRFRNRDGGFYWHSEPAGGNRYKAFHWPGSEIGEAYDEVTVMAMVRKEAYAIRGLSTPTVSIPASPTLLPISNPNAISWQGSVGASVYEVERGPGSQGPWTAIGTGISEDFVQYRPLFVDQQVPPGDWFYRVRAGNASGISPPSNVVGPVAASSRTFVDELTDLNRVQARSGDWEIRSRDCRQAKEDAHRAAGEAGATLTYQLSTAIQAFRLFVFFPSDLTDPGFSVSVNGDSFQSIEAGRQVFFEGTGDYGYWKPVEYRAANLPPNARWLRIELTGETQISRVEIDHDFD